MSVGIPMTPLQILLSRRLIPQQMLQRQCHCSRWTVYRWGNGTNFPRPAQADALVKLFNATGEALDFEGCYGVRRDGEN